MMTVTTAADNSWLDNFIFDVHKASQRNSLSLDVNERKIKKNKK